MRRFDVMERWAVWPRGVRRAFLIAVALLCGLGVSHAGTPTEPIVTLRGTYQAGASADLFLLHLSPSEEDAFGNGRAEMYRLPSGSRTLEFIVKFNQVSTWPRENTFLVPTSNSNEWLYYTQGTNGLKADLLDTTTGDRTPVLFDPNPSVPTRSLIAAPQDGSKVAIFMRRITGSDVTIEQAAFGAEASTVISTLDRNDPAIAGALTVQRPYTPLLSGRKIFAEVLKNDGGFVYSVIEIDYNDPVATATTLREDRLPAFIERFPAQVPNVFAHRAIDASNPTELKFTNFATGEEFADPLDIGFDWTASSIGLSSIFYADAELISQRGGGSFTRIRRAENGDFTTVTQLPDIEIDFPVNLPPVSAYVDDLLNLVPITEGQYDNPDRNQDTIIDVGDLVTRVNEVNQ